MNGMPLPDASRIASRGRRRGDFQYPGLAQALAPAFSDLAPFPCVMRERLSPG
jgi:hypothetical protein